MQPAASTLAQTIAATVLHDASIPVISNISAMPLTTAEAIREELARQIASSVQWAGTIEYLVKVGVTVFIEIGPGSALTGMVKRIAKGITTLTISTVEDIEKAVALIQDKGLSA